MIFWKWGGGSKAVRNFSENSSVLVGLPFPYSRHKYFSKFHHIFSKYFGNFEPFDYYWLYLHNMPLTEQTSCPRPGFLQTADFAGVIVGEQIKSKHWTPCSFLQSNILYEKFAGHPVPFPTCFSTFLFFGAYVFSKVDVFLENVRKGGGGWCHFRSKKFHCRFFVF